MRQLRERYSNLDLIKTMRKPKSLAKRETPLQTTRKAMPRYDDFKTY